SRSWQWSPDSSWLFCRHGNTEDSQQWSLHAVPSLQEHWRDFIRSVPVFAPDSASFAARTLIQPHRVEWLEHWLPKYPLANQVDGVKVWDIRTGLATATYPGGRAFAFFPDGKTLAISNDDSAIEIWDVPPRRPWWIEYGLPAFFALLLLLGARLLW